MLLVQYLTSDPLAPPGNIDQAPLRVDAAHRLIVRIGATDVPFGGGTQYASGIATPSPVIGNALIYDNGGTLQNVSVANPLPVAATFSGTIGTVGQGTAAALSGYWPVGLSDGTNLLGTSSHPIRIDPTGATPQPISGVVSVSNFPTTQGINLSQVGGTSFALGQQLAAASLPIVLTAAQLTTLTPLSTIAVTQSTSPWVISGTVTSTPSGTQNVNLNQVGGSSFSLGQQAAAASLPIVLTAPQLTTLTPLSTITANQGGAPWSQNLTQVGGSSFILGQQLATASLPIVLTAAQLTTLTPLSSVSVSNFPATQGTKEVRSSTDTTATVGGSATVVTLIALNAARLGATIYNDSSALLYIKLGASASLTDFTVVLAGNGGGYGGYYEVPFGYIGIITGIWASATGNARVGELT